MDKRGTQKTPSNSSKWGGLQKVVTLELSFAE